MAAACRRVAGSASCPWRRLLLAWLLVDFGSCAYVPPTKYLIVSNARAGTIGYARLNRDGSAEEVRTLVDKDLVHPQGIAVDQKRQLLLVADSELKKVVSYGLTLAGDGTLAVDEQTPVAEDVDTRWVAVDGPGNVYMTDELQGRILAVGAKQVLDGDTVAKPTFATAGGAISAPGGLATDNFNVFWANKAEGTKVGTLMKALGAPVPNATAHALKPTMLAKNLPKAYGVCLGQNELYFTAPDRDLHRVATAGGEVKTLTSELSTPRGCIWDGQSTVYVADRSANAVFAVSQEAGAVKKVIEYPGAFGVALFSGSASPSALTFALFMSLLLVGAGADERLA